MDVLKMQTHVAIIGAGPAGLTAAYLLSKKGIQVTVLEQDSMYVGGIARTVQYKGFYFDIGGHRFFSKSKEVESLWSEILPEDLLERSRTSRIFYQQQFFSYPLKAFEALFNLGLIQSLLCIFSYIKARLFPIKNPKSFTDWVTNHFGHRLFKIFFKTYTEKVWGMSCDEISADWAAQRIKGLSLFSAIKHAMMPRIKIKNENAKVIKTLIENFRYPRKGPGMLWESCASKCKQWGANIHLDSQVTSCEFLTQQNIWQISYTNQNKQITVIQATHLISTAALKDLVLTLLKPPLPANIMACAQNLQYRDFLIVILILKDHQQLKDNWIYIHDKKVDVARIQNFKAWSEEMVPDKRLCCYGMEYFCFKCDQFWNLSDSLLIEKAKHELVKLGLAQMQDITDGTVIRQPKAYPVYDNNYQENVRSIRMALEKKFPSLYLVGRNGMHKYNNQDHAMMTAMLTVKNILCGQREYDVWCVNQDAEYLESGLRSVPQKLTS